MRNKASFLREIFQKRGILRVMGAHNGLGAKLIEKSGFDGIWASGLEISSSYAVPDANILTMTENLHAATMIHEASGLPVICDCDTGYGNASNVSHMVRKYEAAGIAAVVIEDKLFPKVNSFVPGRQELAGIEEFMGKIEAAKNAQISADFMVFARVEALIAGWGMEEALKRAYSYAEAGADGLVIHSKSSLPDEIYEFASKWKGSQPLVVIPTTFYKVKAEELAQRGFRMVIYANHGLRASIKAMEETFEAIAEAGSSAPVETAIAPLRQVFELQGMTRLKDEEEKYLRKDSPQAVIPAAGKPRLHSGLENVLGGGPICMLDLCGKSLIERQSETFRACGVQEVLAIGGYAFDSIRLEGATLLQNREYEHTGTAYSLLSAKEKIKGKFFMAYSDIIFDRQIAERLMSSPYDITLVMDRAYASLPARDKRLDLVVAGEKEESLPRRRLGSELFKPVRRIGSRLDKAAAKYEFIGLAFFREKGWEAAVRAWYQALNEFKGRSFYEAESVEAADFNDLIQFLIDRGQPVHGLEIEHGWSEIHSLEDYERVNSHFRKHSESYSVR